MNNTLAAWQENLVLTKRLMWGFLFLAIIQLLFGGYTYLEVTGTGVFSLIRNHFDYVGMIISATFALPAIIITLMAKMTDEAKWKALQQKAFLFALVFSSLSISCMLFKETHGVAVESYLAVSLLVGSVLFLILVGMLYFLIRELRSKIASFPQTS